MPDIPDVHTPVPDLGHESLRQSVVAALDGIEQQVARLDRAFLLLLGTGHALQGTLQQLLDAQATQQAVTDLQAAVADLQTRVTALENPPAP